MASVEEDWREALECPVCYELMTPPITMCENGHNTCNTCKPNLRQCPTCRGDFLNVRNKLAETASRSFEHPCRFHTSGCTFTFRFDDKEKHEDECPYGYYKCPLCSVSECQWKGPFKHIKQHIENTHGDKTIQRIGLAERQYNSIAHFTTHGKWYSVVFIGDTVFLYRSKVIDRTLYMCCMFVGTRDDTTYYFLKVIIRNKDGEESTSLMCDCINYLKFNEQNWEEEESIRLHEDFVNKFTDENGRLSFECIINKF